ncbi:hypothetical protein [Pseudomonas sp. GD03730]|uniref:hypothetical protein n=1 Tax=Pseudomonas sp. GD03730 TaxID=2975375 RepID=UPI002447D1A5|nr:hypothetical protein [Pseudomonas sp. GD03730]MDH1403744.1 hypothetical protein [Pseudomonas sp. GD03730]
MRNRTEVIRYNVNERGRDFTGVDREVDIPALCLLLNGPVVQEAVRKGDIFGYMGHGFREKYGLDLPEAILDPVSGKTITLEPAVKTVMIKAYPDGTIEHQQEFLPTSAGRIAQRLYWGKQWGFSSVFFAPMINGKRTPKAFFGMDFVKSPNYDTNRGYDSMLDSTSAGALQGGNFAEEYSAMLDSMDSILAANEKAMDEVNGLADGISKDYLRQCQLNDELVDQNAKLLERISALNKGQTPGAMLDSAPAAVLERGYTFDPDKTAQMLDSARHYMEVPLPGYEDSPADTKAKQEQSILQKGRELVQKVVGFM